MARRATKKTAAKKAPARKAGAGKALATREDLRRRLATTSGESIVGEASGNFISTEGGKFTYKGEQIGTSMIVVIMAYVQDYAWYDRAYDRDNPMPPACFAVANCKAADLVPSEHSPVPQHDNCATCEHNQFGSSETGKGKACKNTYRLAVISPDDLEGDIALVRISPSGYGGFEQFVKKVERNYGMHPGGVLTELTFSEDANPTVVANCLGEYTDDVLAEYLDNPPSENDLIDAVLARSEEATESACEIGYPYDQYEPPPQRGRRTTKKKATSKKKAGRRRAA